MPSNHQDYNTEAVKIANALKPFANKWFDEWGQSCLRSKKMTVSTAPNGTVIGVRDAFGDKEIFIKYMAECSNAKVGDTVWCKWMYNNMQTLYADSMGNLSYSADYVPISGGAFTGNVTFQKDATVNGVLDITQRRCSANLSSVGWYRVLTVNVDGDGSPSFVIDLTITRTYQHGNNELHSIKLLGVYRSFAFSDEISKTNYLEIDKIRYTLNGTIGHIDIHYNYAEANAVSVDFAVHTRQDRQSAFTANALERVADAPSGETVMATYNFATNYYPGNVSTLNYTVIAEW